MTPQGNSSFKANNLSPFVTRKDNTPVLSIKFSNLEIKKNSDTNVRSQNKGSNHTKRGKPIERQEDKEDVNYVLVQKSHSEMNDSFKKHNPNITKINPSQSSENQEEEDLVRVSLNLLAKEPPFSPVCTETFQLVPIQVKIQSVA